MLVSSRLTPLVVLASFVTWVAPALAQPPLGPPEARSERRVALLPSGRVLLTSMWAPVDEDSTLTLQLGDATPISLVRGGAPGAVEASGAVALVAYVIGGDAHPFRTALVRADASGHLTIGALQSLARPGARTDDDPFGVVIAPTPGGFTVLFQETQRDDPTALRTYAFAVDGEGAPRDAGREMPLPWPLAAAAWNGAGFHLALFFRGHGTGMRLSMVSITPEGQRRQHPDWSSAAGFVSDVHLDARDGHVRAFYRGGASGDRLLESDVTTIRSWGSEPPRARDHGALAESAVIGMSADGSPSRIPPSP